jgi:hypothetical protein
MGRHTHSHASHSHHSHSHASHHHHVHHTYASHGSRSSGGQSIDCTVECCWKWWPTIIGLFVCLLSFVFSIILSTGVGFDVSNYQPPEANLERHTKLLGRIAVAAPILSGVAVIIILTFSLAVDGDAGRIYDLVMSAIVALIAGFLLGVGGDIYVTRSDIDSLILPYRVIWAPKTVWASEVQEDFECCGFDAITPPESELSCSSSLPFCRYEIAEEYDRDVLDLGATALVFGAIDAIVAVAWAVFAVWKFCHPDYKVEGQPEPVTQGEATYPPPYAGAESLPPSPMYPAPYAGAVGLPPSPMYPAPYPGAQGLSGPASSSPLYPQAYPGAQPPLSQAPYPPPPEDYRP